MLEHIISYCSNPNYSLEERVKLKSFLSTDIDICTNIYKQYKKAKINVEMAQ